MIRFMTEAQQQHYHATRERREAEGNVQAFNSTFDYLGNHWGPECSVWVWPMLFNAESFEFEVWDAQGNRVINGGVLWDAEAKRYSVHT